MNALFDPICRNTRTRDSKRAAACRGHDLFAALLCVAIVVVTVVLMMEPAGASEPEANEAVETKPIALDVQSDRWLYGPNFRVLAGDAPVRPFLMGGFGAPEAPWQLGIDWPWSERDSELHGRLGAGFDVGLGPNSLVSLQGSYVQGLEQLPQTPARDEQGFGTVGARFQLRF